MGGIRRWRRARCTAGAGGGGPAARLGDVVTVLVVIALVIVFLLGAVLLVSGQDIARYRRLKRM